MNAKSTFYGFGIKSVQWAQACKQAEKKKSRKKDKMFHRRNGPFDVYNLMNFNQCTQRKVMTLTVMGSSYEQSVQLGRKPFISMAWVRHKNNSSEEVTQCICLLNGQLDPYFQPDSMSYTEAPALGTHTVTNSYEEHWSLCMSAVEWSDCQQIRYIVPQLINLNHPHTMFCFWFANLVCVLFVESLWSSASQINNKWNL